MKHLLIILSLLLLSSPVIGNSHKGETLYLWKNPSGDGYIWKGFGDKETHPVYKGDVKNGKPDGLGIIIYPTGTKYVGSWKNGEYFIGTQTFDDEYVGGGKYVGEYRNKEVWKGIFYDEDGNIEYKVVNGVEQ